MFSIDNILHDGDGSGSEVVDSRSYETKRFRKQSVLGIYNDERVHEKIGEILTETPLIYHKIRVADGEKIDAQSHPVLLEKNIKVYLVPMDITLAGGLAPLISQFNENSKLVYMTDKPTPAPFSPLKPLTITDRNIECYVGVSTVDLLSNNTTERFKQFMQYHVDYNPLHVLIFTPDGYEKMEQNVKRYFKTLRIDPEVDIAKTPEEAREKLNRKHYDELRLPKSYRDCPEDMDRLRGASLNKRIWILYGSRDNGVYFIGNMD